MSRRVVVGLGGRSYDVLVGPGLLDAAGEAITPFLKRKRLAVVSDRRSGVCTGRG